MDDMYYILEGHETKKATFKEWAEWYGKRPERHVADETINGSRISTVFLGINHAYDSGPLLLFETLVFGGKLDGEMDRYTTWEQAEAGHKEMVGRVIDATDNSVED